MKKERLIIPGSIAATVAAAFAGNHVREVKMKDLPSVTRVWKEDKAIGKGLRRASQSTSPIVVEVQEGGRKYIASVKPPEIKPLRENLQAARDAVDRTGRAPGIRDDLDRVIARVDDGPTISDNQGRFVDGFQPIRNGINDAADKFADEEASMDRRKWVDRALIGLGLGAVVGAPAAESWLVLKQIKKAKEGSNKPKKRDKTDGGSGDRKRRWLGRQWDRLTTLPHEKKRKEDAEANPVLTPRVLSRSDSPSTHTH
ncbi:MAG TPA: hypothetical protein VM077_05800 [Candidatus Limnocylindrales bacterium]|nr:hypothetical protein [Candidatus Limnocylindrales bacterium]